MKRHTDLLFIFDYFGMQLTNSSEPYLGLQATLELGIACLWNCGYIPRVIDGVHMPHAVFT